MISFKRLILSAFIFLGFYLETGFSEPIKPFIVFSPPKTGTHLIGKCLELMTGKKACYCLSLNLKNSEVIDFIEAVQMTNEFVVAHDFNREQLDALTAKGYKIIFMVRDPRDHLVSVLDWFKEGQWNWLPVSRMGNLHEQITEMITGNLYGWKSFDNCILNKLKHLEKLTHLQVAIIKFEDLIGSKGQGNDDLQSQSIQKIGALINLNVTSFHINLVANKLFGDSPTFRHGQIGRWKEYFTPAHVELFKLHYGRAVTNMGYKW
ncbi:MAG: sulfotransferase domain-containing protein [Parachlamydiaceae bacterium]|nr:sulfotransferase domain-containing protein [Parachlamydiaceae bacterium]